MALRTDAEPFEYPRERQPRPQLGPYVVPLEQWLEAESTCGRTTRAEYCTGSRWLLFKSGRMHGLPTT
jgi:hypothetical protein